VILGLYAAIAAITVGLVYLGLVINSQNSLMGLATTRQFIGKTLFLVVTLMEILGMMVITPGMMAGEISSEREQDTLDLLKITALPMRSVIWGKFLSGLGFSLMIVLISVPLQSIVFLFGGVTFEEVFINLLVALLTAMMLNATGLFFSSRLQSTTRALIWSYGLPAFIFVILPIIVLILTPAIISWENAAGASSYAIFADAAVLLGAWILISINPATAVAVSEWVWINNHSLFVYPYSLKNGGLFPLYSPWILFSIISVLLCLILMWGSIHFAGKMEN
jgi:ABC-type transport system involved in multi-copper enzyme maturation permease subunit